MVYVLWVCTNVRCQASTSSVSHSRPTAPKPSVLPLFPSLPTNSDNHSSWHLFNLFVSIVLQSLCF